MFQMTRPLQNSKKSFVNTLYRNAFGRKSLFAINKRPMWNFRGRLFRVLHSRGNFDKSALYPRSQARNLSRVVWSSEHIVTTDSTTKVIFAVGIKSRDVFYRCLPLTFVICAKHTRVFSIMAYAAIFPFYLRFINYLPSAFALSIYFLRIEKYWRARSSIRYGVFERWVFVYAKISSNIIIIVYISAYKNWLPSFKTCAKCRHKS